MRQISQPCTNSHVTAGRCLGSDGMGCLRSTILLFLGCAEIFLELSRILQGVTKADWIAITQKQEACKEGTKHQESPRSSERALRSVQGGFQIRTRARQGNMEVADMRCGVMVLTMPHCAMDKCAMARDHLRSCRVGRGGGVRATEKKERGRGCAVRSA
jgi:hypothetical protein